MTTTNPIPAPMFLVIHCATGDTVAGPADQTKAYHQHMRQRRHTAVLLTTDERLAHSDSRGYYVPAGTTVPAGLSDDVYELWQGEEEVA